MERLLRLHVRITANATVQKNVLVVAKKTKIALAKTVIAKNAIVPRVIAPVEIIANAEVSNFSKFLKNQNANAVVSNTFGRA